MTASPPGACWVPVPEGSPFPLHNLPLGVFTPAGGGGPRVGAAIGAHVLDLAALWAGLPLGGDLATGSLNRFLRRGPREWAYLRREVTRVLSTDERRAHAERHLHRIDEVTLHLPIEVADYTDFDACEAHAVNAARVLRPGAPPLAPNWRRIPVGYHGRAGTVVVSGTDVRRPCGLRGIEGDGPAAGGPGRGGSDGGDSGRTGSGDGGGFGPTRRLDLEAEVAFVVGAPSAPGRAVPVAGFTDHVFGALLLNDWSARDIQSFESRPLGPFLGKSFATSVSPWVVPLAALEHARIPGPPQEPAPPRYLAADPEQPWGLDLELTVAIGGAVVSRPRFREMYWSPAQMLAHLTVNGAPLRTGDLYASGTVSGAEPGRRGSLLELTRDGAEPLRLPDGSTRGYLADGDTVTIRATAPGPPGAAPIGFGEVTGRVLPAGPSGDDG